VRDSHRTAVEINALFASDVQPSQHLSPEDVDIAIEIAIGRWGWLGCAEIVAAEFGDHPNLAMRRMQWVLRTLGHESEPEGAPLALPRRRR
jgi:hypothetical protein